jgi:hypothetical protein
MSAKAVREFHGKKLLARHVKEVSEGVFAIDDRSVSWYYAMVSFSMIPYP